MTSPVIPVHALKAGIADLEFKMENRMHSECDIGIEKLMSEKNTEEAQISELQGRLNELVSALHSTKGMDFSIDDQNMRPLISTLPYEMLSAVFKKAPKDPSGRVRFARSVSQVSHYWRKTAMQTPYLWSGIRIFRSVYEKMQTFVVCLIDKWRFLTLRDMDLRQTRRNLLISTRHSAIQRSSIVSKRSLAFLLTRSPDGALSPTVVTIQMISRRLRSLSLTCLPQYWSPSNFLSFSRTRAKMTLNHGTFLQVVRLFYHALKLLV